MNSWYTQCEFMFKTRGGNSNKRKPIHLVLETVGGGWCHTWSDKQMPNDYHYICNNCELSSKDNL